MHKTRIGYTSNSEELKKEKYFLIAEFTIAENFFIARLQDCSFKVSMKRATYIHRQYMQVLIIFSFLTYYFLLYT